MASETELLGFSKFDFKKSPRKLYYTLWYRLNIEFYY